MRLDGKRVIITGGTTGIGAAVAQRFITEGARVAVWGRNPDNVKAMLRDTPGLLAALVADVAAPVDVDRAFAESISCLGGLDVIICNAGTSIRRNFVDITREEFDRVMR